MENRYLFKAKRIDNGEWVQGNYVNGLDVFTNCEEIHIIFEPNTMFYIGVACAIVHNINSEKYSEDEKIEALKMFLEMPTHNGTTKEQILKAFQWFWNFCIEESEEN